MAFLLVLLLMNFFYAGAPTFIKLASVELQPLQIVYLRHTLALLALLPFFLACPNKKIGAGDFIKIMLGSCLAFTAASLLQVIGMQYSHATDGSFIMSMEPILVILLAYFFLAERLNFRMVGGLLLALLGFTLLSNTSPGFESGGGGRWYGNLLFLLATMAEASFPIFLKPLLKKYSPLLIAFYSLLCASFYMLPFQGDLLWKTLPHLHFQTFVSVAYLGLGCSFLAALLWLVCLKRATATMVSISWFIQPLFGSLFAMFLLGEAVTANVLTGGGLILSALGLLTVQIPHFHFTITPGIERSTSSV